MNLQTASTPINSTVIPQDASPQRAPVNYLNISRQAASYGIPASVHLEKRILLDYLALDSEYSETTAGVILALLAWQRALKEEASAQRLTVCLIRRADRQIIEVDLMVLYRSQIGGPHIYLRMAGVRELPCTGAQPPA